MEYGKLKELKKYTSTDEQREQINDTWRGNRILLGEQGITIASILSVIGMTIGFLVELFTPSPAPTLSPTPTPIPSLNPSLIKK